ncbi:hypothetical protein F5Y11DRAFT_355676 [Daldinia sp. FL1419]|nr:hypothetical protein F5Y11DRAFT_355676 [Daldinia sp. FL1419]
MTGGFLEFMESYPSHRLECHHGHCRKCISANVQKALESRPFAPAKCCHAITDDILEAALGNIDDTLNFYRQKMREMANPGSNLYCHDRDCGRFIPKENYTKRVGTCGCGKKTCKTCGEKAHFGPCSQTNMDKTRHEEEQVYQLAQREGWKRCPNCRSIVQKIEGCDHME